MSTCTIVLLVFAIIVVVADIVLALCLRTILPKHLTENGYYLADNRSVPFAEAIHICPCLAGVFFNDTKQHIVFGKVRKRVPTIKTSTTLHPTYYNAKDSTPQADKPKDDDYKDDNKGEGEDPDTASPSDNINDGKNTNQTDHYDDAFINSTTIDSTTSETPVSNETHPLKRRSRLHYF